MATVTELLMDLRFRNRETLAFKEKKVTLHRDNQYFQFVWLPKKGPAMLAIDE